MNERDDLPSYERSRTTMDKAATSGNVVATGPGPATERFSLDYASWYARIAAPGSRVTTARPTPRPIVRLDTAVHPANSAELERRIA
jgi:hypothetical protein